MKKEQIEDPQVETKDKTLLGIMTFHLDSNITLSNEIHVKQSELKEVQESLIQEIQDKEDRGYLVIQGTPASPLDITMIPLKRLVCMKFCVEVLD